MRVLSSICNPQVPWAQSNAVLHKCFLASCFRGGCLPVAGEDDYEQVEKGRVKGEVEGEEAGKME